METFDLEENDNKFSKMCCCERHTVQLNKPMSVTRRKTSAVIQSFQRFLKKNRVMNV